jgi:hypothetical protein
MVTMAFWHAIAKTLGLPTEPERRARAAFRELHPEQCIAWSRVAAEEVDRFVVGVFYGDSRPPRYCFFAISRASAGVTPLDDDSAYRPKVWR